jgi:hypothetical protein
LQPLVPNEVATRPRYAAILTLFGPIRPRSRAFRHVQGLWDVPAPATCRSTVGAVVRTKAKVNALNSVVALIVDNPQRWTAKDGSQQYVLPPYTVAYVVDGQLIRPSRSL